MKTIKKYLRDKRFRYGFLAAFLVFLILFFMWPISFPEMNEEVPSITLIRMDAALNVETANQIYQRGSPEYERIDQILRKYSYHRSVFTYIADSFLKRNEAGYWIYLYMGKQGNVILSGTGTVMLNQHVYRMGFVGGASCRAMMQELQDVLGP